MFFKTMVQDFVQLIFYVPNVQTNKHILVYMPEDNTTKTSLCTYLVKLYKIVLRFALGPLVLEILKHTFFPAGFWTD